LTLPSSNNSVLEDLSKEELIKKWYRLIQSFYQLYKKNRDISNQTGSERRTMMMVLQEKTMVVQRDIL
jgi:site-specific DNA-adenine methylase